MKNKINVAELLKDCPVGMELDCAIYEKVLRYAECTAVIDINQLDGDVIETPYGSTKNGGIIIIIV